MTVTVYYTYRSKCPTHGVMWLNSSCGEASVACCNSILHHDGTGENTLSATDQEHEDSVVAQGLAQETDTIVLVQE